MRRLNPAAGAVMAVIALCGTTASSQTFSIDDNPMQPLTGYQGFGFGAEDPFGLNLPPVVMGRCGPSPTLLHPVTGPFLDGVPDAPAGRPADRRLRPARRRVSRRAQRPTTA